MSDPTYDRKLIDANPVWKQAFKLSEMNNDNAPLGWFFYVPAAMAMMKKGSAESQAVDFKPVSRKKALIVR